MRAVLSGLETPDAHFEFGTVRQWVRAGPYIRAGQMEQSSGGQHTLLGVTVEVTRFNSKPSFRVSIATVPNATRPHAA